MGDLHRAFVDKQDGSDRTTHDARGTGQPAPPATGSAAMFVVTPPPRLFPTSTQCSSNLALLSLTSPLSLVGLRD